MYYLFSSIIASTIVFIIFKSFSKFNIKTFDVIVLNYFFGFLFGLIFNNPFPLLKNNYNEILHTWFVPALILGVFFIIMFYLISLSSQKAGMTVTSVSCKMSFIIPLCCSVIIDPADKLGLLKISGIIVALIAVFLTIYNKKNFSIDKSRIYLPVLLFTGTGFCDSIIKYSQYKFIPDNELLLFCMMILFIAGIVGIVYTLIIKYPFRNYFIWKNILASLVLGIMNYIAFVSLIYALDFRSSSYQLDGSVVFSANNSGIVALSVLVGFFYFKEKISLLNWIGIFLTFVSVYILTYY